MAEAAEPKKESKTPEGRPYSLLSGLHTKIVLTFLLPTLLTVGLFVWFASFRLQEALDVDLGQRLISVAQSAKVLLPGDEVSEILPGEENSRNYKNLRKKLLRLQKETGVRRIYLFNPDHTSVLDTKKTPIGKKYVKLAFEKQEIEAVFKGKVRASVLFPDQKGTFYKTGFAPLYEEKEIIAAIAVEGSASYFSVLRMMQNSLYFFSILSLLLVILIGILFASWLVRPVRRLVQAARNIGRGELTEPLPHLQFQRDEIGFLAQTMEEMRQNIQARDRQMQMMLSGIAHEVRNPLGGMELFSGILKEELAGDEDKLSHVNRIQRETRYLAEVVNNFLDFARPTELDMQEHGWEDFLFELTMLLSADAGSSEVQLKLVREDLPKTIHFDQRRLQQALINLIQNAIQASPKGSSITLRTVAESQGGKEGHVLSIEDQGQGIPKEKLKDIFEPFFTTKEKGTGLGLPLAAKIIESHSGNIDIESEEGKGTTVRIWLPKK